MKIKQTLIAIALLIGVSSFAFSPAVGAEDCKDADGKVIYSTSIIPCSAACPDSKAPVNGLCSDGSKPNAIWGILLLGINILTAGVALVAVGGVLVGSIKYMTAGGDMSQLKAAKNTIYNVVAGLIVYALMYAFLNFIIPGGMF